MVIAWRWDTGPAQHRQCICVTMRLLRPSPRQLFVKKCDGACLCHPLSYYPRIRAHIWCQALSQKWVSRRNLLSLSGAPFERAHARSFYACAAPPLGATPTRGGAPIRRIHIKGAHTKSGRGPSSIGLEHKATGTTPLHW